MTPTIDLALESGARLTFLHVIDAYATVGPLSIIYSELMELSQFMILILCDRAERHGLRQMDFIIREGSLRKQLLQFAVETHAALMVLGQPLRNPGRNVFRAAEFEGFVAELPQTGNLDVLRVTPSPFSSQG